MFALVKMLKTRVGSDRGASALEYVGAVIVAAIVVSALVMGINSVKLDKVVTDRLGEITNPSGNGGGEKSENGGGEKSENGGGENK